MGCCASTPKSTRPTKTPPPPHIANSKTTSTAKRSSISKSPPPTHPLLEEETVKEVLSETPAVPKPAHIPRFQGNTHRRSESPFIKSSPLLSDFSRNGAVCKKPFAAYGGGDDLSEEVSEICSTLGESEGVSVSTTMTEKRDNNDELRELRQRSPARLKNRSFSGEVKREKTVGRSPGRRSEPSPSRARPVNGPGYVRRKDSGESSGRRSRSPVTRTTTETGPSRAGLGRSPSGRKTGKSPGRVGSGLGERIRKMEEGKDNKWPPTNNESLENPLVSLECFIFL